MDVRGGPVAKDDSAAPKPLLAFPKEEERPRTVPSAVFTSHTASEGWGSTPLHDLMLHPNVNGPHPFLWNHFNRKGAWKGNCNHLVRSREQRENILYSRINCPSSKCHWGESYNGTGEKHWAVEESQEKKEAWELTERALNGYRFRKRLLNTGVLTVVGNLAGTWHCTGGGGGSIISMKVHWITLFTVSLWPLFKCPDFYNKNWECNFSVRTSLMF